MCTSPIHITTSLRSRYFYRSQPSLSSVDAPCGNCEQCLMQSRNDMYLRVKAEYEDCIKHGCKCVFLTFTYRESDVPYLHYSLSDSGEISFERVQRFSHSYDDSECIFSFDKGHLQTFFNSLRKFITRKYASSLGLSMQAVKGFSPFRYIVVGEYGTDGRYTQRCHYHALLFLDPKTVSLFGGLSMCQQISFLTLCQHFWQYGNVSASDKGLVVDNDFCCGYVAKYIGKSLSLLKLDRFSRFCNFIKDNFSKIVMPDDYNYSPSYLSYFKYFMRVSSSKLFIMKSKNFGLSLIDDLRPYVQDSDELMKRIEDGVQVVRHSKSQRLRYPKYILRKLFYKFRADGSYYLSDLGLKTVYHVYKKYVDDAVKCLDDSTFSVPMIERVIHDHYYFTPCHYDPLAVYDAINFIRSRPYAFFIYAFLFRGRVFPCESSDFTKILFTCDSTNYEEVLAITLNYCYSSYDSSSEPYFESVFQDGSFVHKVNFGSVSTVRPRTSLTLKEYLELYPDSYSDEFFISSFDHAYFHYNFIVNLMRDSLLKYYAELNDKAKSLSDLTNFKHYGLPA